MQVDEAFRYIQRAYAANRMPVSLIITGNIRREAGELATRILQVLFCREETAPCGQCARCQRVREQSAFDVVWIVPEKKSRQISIEQIRERLLSTITQTSLEGGWKAGVLIGADRMNQAAANAFLKTLEEPPPNTLLLLLTDSPQSLLPTILSRCQRIDVDTHVQQGLPLHWRDNLLTILSAALPPGPVSALATAGQICAILGEIKLEAGQQVRTEVRDEVEVEVSSDVQNARIEANYREMRQTLLVTLQAWYRDLLVLCTDATDELLHFPHYQEILHARAQHLTLAQALANITAVEGIQRQLERNISESVVFAYWLDRIVTGVPA